jgi:hypothetical protein
MLTFGGRRPQSWADRGQHRQAGGAFAAPIRSVELIVQPGAKDGVGEMGVRGGLSPGRSATASAGRVRIVEVAKVHVKGLYLTGPTRNSSDGDS